MPSLFQHCRLAHRLLSLLCAGLLVLPVSVLQAQQVQQVQQVLQAQQSSGAAQAPRISQREALELVRARFPGNVVSISEVQQDGTLQYRVRMDNDGNIFTVYVNADTGDIRREQ